MPKRRSLKSQLDATVVVSPDGSRRPLRLQEGKKG